MAWWHLEVRGRHRGDVNLVTHEGATPLHLAVRLEEGLCSTVLPPLVLAKAEVNKRDQARAMTLRPTLLQGDDRDAAQSHEERVQKYEYDLIYIDL